MVSIQQALPICVIASVLVRGYVLIAADMEDFKNLANTFLTDDLANQLTGLVSESSHDHTRTQPTDEKVPEVKLSKIGNIIKDKLLKEYKTPYNASTHNVTISPIDYNRRYRTVKNHDDESNHFENNIMRQPDYANAKLEPQYLRDELENLLQNMADHAYNSKENNYADSKLKEIENIFSQERREPKGLFDKIIDQNTNDNYGIFKKPDYTETKLGDWNYNPETSQKPITIKNVKSGYTYQPDKNNGRNIPEKWNLEKQVSEEYDIFSNSWNDKIKTTKHRIVGLNNPVNHDLHIKPHNVKQKERQKYKPKKISFEQFDSYESLPSGSKNKGSSANKAKKEQVLQYDNFEQDFLEPKYDNIRNEKTLSKKDFKFSFESENKFHDKIKDYNQQAEEYDIFEKQIFQRKEEDIQKQSKAGNYMNNAHTSELKNKPSNVDRDTYQNRKESYNLEPKVKDIYKEKPRKEENDMYEKNALSYKSDESYETKIHYQQIPDSDTNLGIKNKDKHQNKKESYHLEPKNKDIQKRKPHKQMMEENDVYEKYALSYKSDESDAIKIHYQQISDSDKNLRIRNKDKHQNEKQSYHLEPENKDIHKRKPHKQIMEENDVYEKYSLSYKSDDSLETKDDHQQTYDSAKNFEFKNKFEDKHYNAKDSYNIVQKDKDIHKRRPYPQSREENKFNDNHESNVYHHTYISDKNPENRNKIDYKFSAPKKHNLYESTSNEMLFLNNKKRLNEEAPFKENPNKHQFVTEASKKPENSDDSESGAKEIDPGPIKANTEYLIDSNEFTNKPEVVKANTENLLDTVEGNRKSTKKFTMKGTEIPKREFYKMSSPDYYHKLPRIVEKYDFGEPIPERDRIRNKVKHVKREPAMINRKIKLSH